MFELNHRIRLVKLREFDIKDLKMFYGFLNGLVAQNYDIERIYIDGLLEFIKEDITSFADFLSDVDSISKKFNIRFIITMNGDPDSVPTFLKEYIA